MPDLQEAVGPGAAGVLLVPGRGVAVVQVELGVGRGGQAGHLHPSHQLAGRVVEALDLVAELGGPVGGSEQDVVTRAGRVLGVCGQVGIGGQADQHREVGLVGGHQGVLDGDLLAILPAGAVPVAGQRRQLAEIQVEGVAAGGQGGVILAGGIDHLGEPVGGLCAGVEQLAARAAAGGGVHHLAAIQRIGAQVEGIRGGHRHQDIAGEQTQGHEHGQHQADDADGDPPPAAVGQDSGQHRDEHHHTHQQQGDVGHDQAGRI